MAPLLLYGSYGYVGHLVAQELLDRGRDPILAGRDAEALSEQATDLDCRYRQFGLTDHTTVAELLADVDCVLNCAGPFSNTAETLADGCLQSGTDYVDITGEIPVIERLQDRDAAASNAGVTLFPSTGFSSIPMDCLAAHLAGRFPEATQLALGVDSMRPPSIGTIRTVIEGIEDGGTIRRDGDLEDVPAAWRTRRIDFGRGTHPGVTMPLGDVSTAYYTTGIPNVEAYAVMPQPARLVLKSHRLLTPLLEPQPVREILKQSAGVVREGPSERARERGSAYIWGEARTGDERAVSRLETPDPYPVTVDGSVTVTERVLDGAVDSGYQTPAGAFGADFVLELDGVMAFVDEPMQRRVAAGPRTTESVRSPAGSQSDTGS